MTKLTNSKGNLVDTPSVAATKEKNESDEFQALGKADSNTLDDLGAEFDLLLVRMQTPKARKGMNSAFRATPSQLRRAAVKATRKRR